MRGRGIQSGGRTLGADPTAVRLDSDFRRRLDRLALRMDAARLRQEGTGRRRLDGGGEEWVDFRPYRVGDDPRALDWTLLARLDRAFVRRTRREATERVAIWVDTSASMGLGQPGKLQAAAELAAGVAAVALREGAEVALFADVGPRPIRTARRPSDLAGVLEELGRLRAAGANAIPLDALARHSRAAGRSVLITDLATAPDAALFALSIRRELALVHVLARDELEPRTGLVRWRCPETGAELELDVDDAAVARYEALLSRRLEAWRGSTALHGVRHLVHASDAEFERGVQDLLRGQGSVSPQLEGGRG